MPEAEASIGPRAFWSGTLTFGLVSIPVDLYSAQRSVKPRLRMLAPDGAPLSRVYVCPREERPIEADEIVRGYELGRLREHAREPEAEPPERADGEDRFVLVSDEELEALEPDKSRDIHLRRFVPCAKLPPAHYRRAYYLAPAGQSTRAYAVLAQTMERGDRAGIATFVMRGKEYLVAIFARGGILRAQTLRFADEVRSPADVGLEGAPPKPSARAIARMEHAIDELARDDIPLEPFRDERSAAIEALAQRKLERGEDVVEHEAEVEVEGAWEPPDLVALLKQRLAGSEEAQSAPRADDLEGRSRSELYSRAQELAIEGRSRMSKDELVRAIRSASG